MDGNNVVLDYSTEEKEITDLLKREVGGEICMVPRVNNPQGVSTPDYLINGECYDLKRISGNGKNTLYNAVSKKKKQSNNFIFEASKTSLALDELEDQVSRLYTSNHTSFIEKIVLLKNRKIIRVYKKRTDHPSASKWTYGDSDQFLVSVYHNGFWMSREK